MSHSNSPAAKKNSAATGSVSKGKKAPQSETTGGSWYDHPEYYDAGFAEGILEEVSFYEDVFKKFVPFPVKNVFEPGCGSGRVVVELAKRGYSLTGLDLSKSMLNYCRDQLKANGVKAKLVQGDMTDFQLDGPIDAALNPVNTFRHLLTEEDARKHLQCVSDNLKVGGVYILGLHLVAKDMDMFGAERWQAKYQDSRIYYTLAVEESNSKTRVEKLRLTMTVKGPKESFRFIDHLDLRLYNVAQIKSLIKTVPSLKIAGVYDFWYDIDDPVKLDSNTCDTVLILQRV